MKRNSSAAGAILSLAIAGLALAGCSERPEPMALSDDAFRPQFSGTGGNIFPVAMHLDPSGEFVGAVELLIQVGWSNTPHHVDVRITSVNGSDHDHGHQVNALRDLEVLEGSIEKGLAVVVVPWTADTSPRTGTDIYTVCAHGIFGTHHGSETCEEFTKSD